MYFIASLTKHRDILNQKLGQQAQIIHQKNKIEERINTLSEELKDIIRSKEIIVLTAQEVQNKLSYHIDNIVNMTLNTVFINPYKFELKFITKAGKTEAVCEFTSSDGNVITDILDTCGGGVADIVAFGLRLAMLKLAKQRQILLLDEPFKNLSEEYVDRASILLKKVSEHGIQIILNTHITKLVEKGDKIFSVTKRNDISKVKEMGNG